MLKTAAFPTHTTPARQDAPFRGFVLSRMFPCGLAWDKARLGATGLGG